MSLQNCTKIITHVIVQHMPTKISFFFDLQHSLARMVILSMYFRDSVRTNESLKEKERKKKDKWSYVDLRTSR